ncbi:MAG: hypothetical protein HS126_18915 [Anaerolineales bacterium]|nr:hypothetical protein [Anaerolineales bacterium]
MTDPSQNEELNKYAFQYDPQQVLRPKRQTGWIIIGVLLCILLGVAGTLGVIRWLNLPVSNALPESTPVADLIIAGAVNETALVIIDTHNESSQLKIANTTTNTVVIQDLTRGKLKALAASLSVQKDRVAFIKEEDGHRDVIVINTGTGLTTPLERAKLIVPTLGTQIEPCSWSPIAWSPDGARFSFFGCDKTTSMLIVVEAQTELTPVVLTNTQATQTPNRQAVWLNNENLLYTHLDPTTEQTWISRIGILTDSVPFPVYGR